MTTKSTNSNYNPGTLPAGIYYVGDLCYVVDDNEWREYCDRSFPNGDNDEVVGVFQASSGVSYAMFGTMHGDGVYVDNYNNEYPVDSGSIGCIPVSEVWNALDDPNIKRLGNVVTFTEPFKVSYDFETGLISIGNIDIMTGDEGDDEDDGNDEDW